MNELTTLESIERRINFHIHGAYANILEVGRCLNEAKASGLVPHGEWENWVNRVAGMTERSAQRLMQAAREVSPDSAMTILPISKIQAILALPEADREPMAEKAVEENLSLRQLKDEIAAMKQALKDRQAEEMKAKRQAERSNQAAEAARANTDRALEQLNTVAAERDSIRRKLDEVMAQPAEGISKEAQAEIDRLNARVQEAEEMAEYQANARQKAQQELMDLKSQAARGDNSPAEDLTAESVAMAVRTFMGVVGFLPHSDRLMTMRYQDRQQVDAFAQMIGKWSEDVRHALSCVNEAIVIQGVEA